jgi:hypothetical protein
MSLTLTAQDKSIYLTIGKPWFQDKEKNLNNFSVGAHYQNRLSDAFAFELNVEHASSDNFPSFFNDSNELNAFLSNQMGFNIILNSMWSNINTLSFGGKINYIFINNKRFLFNFNLGLGYQFSKSKAHTITEFSSDAETSQIIYYQNQTISDNYHSFYYSLGMQFQYCFFKNYFIGISPSLLIPREKNNYESIPVLPTYYNLNLNLGKRF